jgi:hypothetical protein
MREKFYRFMAGRYGSDQLSRALGCAALLLIIVNFFARTTVLYVAALALLLFLYYRTFSRKLEKRRRENAWFLQKSQRVKNAFANWRDRQRQRRDYVFFRCPSCRAMLRVPRGKGRIRVTCRKCGAAFERRT